MKDGYLLDTSILIWAVQDDERLSDTHRHILTGADPVLVSVASFWEIAIKQSLGKLRIDGDLRAVIRDSGIELLPIRLDHIDRILDLPFHHRDPFDRMLIAQARAEKLTILTSDRHFRSYDITLV